MKLRNICGVGTLLCVLPSCTVRHVSPALPQTPEQHLKTADRRLVGQWKADAIQSNNADWNNLAECWLIVYEDKDFAVGKRDSRPELLLAELLTRGKDDGLKLAHDTQPVSATNHRLYFGPIGSCYIFEYQFTERGLSLKLVSGTDTDLRLDFIRTQKAPGAPRFPEISNPERPQ